LTELKSGVGAHTISEILSEPATWKSCLQSIPNGTRLQSLNRAFSSKVEWVFVGCGSSFYLAQSAAASWTILTGERARAIPASEILLFPELLPVPCQPVCISRSGHTSEVLQVMEYLEHKLNVRCHAITCATDTPLEKMATQCVRLPTADEKSTVMTRSFTSMLTVLQALAAGRGERSDVIDGLRKVPDQVAAHLNQMQSTIDSLVKSRQFADYVFLGQGPFFGIAQESMLKVMEMSCSYAQSFHTLEFRHGPKAMVSPETLVTFIVSESGLDAEVAVLEEIKNLGGTTLVVANRCNATIRRFADFVVELSLDVPEIARVGASVIAGQLLGFYAGIKKGLNPDEPKNLSRVVMLESGG